MLAFHRSHTTRARDKALRDLHRINRWMIAGSVILTGVLSDVAANAFPGKTVKRGSSSKALATHKRQGSTTKTSTSALRPPQQPPVSSESEPSQPATPSEPAQETPRQESTPSQPEAPAPAQEPTPAQEPPSTQERAPEREAPVVSGGS